MSNYYAYMNRMRGAECQAIYEADIRRKEKQNQIIQDFFYNNTIDTEKQETISFTCIAISHKAIVFLDDLQCDFWVATYNKSSSTIKEITRCSSLADAKDNFYRKSLPSIGEENYVQSLE